MTPKEKAKQLIKKFTSSTRRLVADYEWVEDIDSAKKCALIAVYEMLEEISKWSSGEFQEFEKERWKYLQEVQQELFNY